MQNKIENRQEDEDNSQNDNSFDSYEDAFNATVQLNKLNLTLKNQPESGISNKMTQKSQDDHRIPNSAIHNT